MWVGFFCVYTQSFWLVPLFSLCFQPFQAEASFLNGIYYLAEMQNIP